MKLLNQFICLGMFLLFIGCSETPLDKIEEQEVQRRSTEDLCIATWNTQLFDVGDVLPGSQCEGEDCNRRARSICEQVAELMNPLPDIVNFQEVFEEEATEELIECMTALGYGYNTGYDDWDGESECEEEVSSAGSVVGSILGGFLGGPIGALIGGVAGGKIGSGIAAAESEGSGLITFSRLPIQSSTTEDFEDCNGCLEDKSDCFADKGFEITEIVTESGCVYTNINTHLDAGDSPDDAAARASQLNQINDWLIANMDPDAPFSVSGDFNIRRNSNEYNFLLNTLGLDNVTSIAGVQDGVTASDGQTLDYIFGNVFTTATYDVWYQEEVCWWEYREVVYEYHNDIEEEIGVYVEYVTRHTFDTFEEIPVTWQGDAVEKCRSVEINHEVIGEQCGWYFSGSGAMLYEEYGEEIFEVYDYYDNFYEIPEDLQQYFIEHCFDIRLMNPSDHNPVMSCVEFYCD